MKITINLLKEKDAKELLQFETDNRTFFEKMVPSRGEDYYVLEAFRIRHKELLVEQDEGISKFYLIRGDNGQIVGRINLVDINEKEFSGSIGFRIGEQYIGKGIANLALKLLLEIESGIKMIYGKTTTNNIASQKVMEKNGFKKVSFSEDEIEMNGQKLKFINYIWEPHLLEDEGWYGKEKAIQIVNEFNKNSGRTFIAQS